ncbi:hypothetical protein A606_10575 [Corynebacterium terpenotabidum Y-11]|uniref:Uncharacterized protein n=1 Tax=Corynebacterium terpenotabidum Y-11 TaxID=1200352 RepID=S4XGP5_9CORY|nr:hypothetical protein A606_10575 [Corynebacterium terpenotabidum Y-11]
MALALSPTYAVPSDGWLTSCQLLIDPQTAASAEEISASDNVGVAGVSLVPASALSALSAPSAPSDCCPSVT